MNNDNSTIHSFISTTRTAISIICCCFIWLLGNPTSTLAITGKSASEAIADMDRVLGDPEELIDDAYLTVEDFIKNHIGSLAVATAFSLGLRSIFK